MGISILNGYRGIRNAPVTFSPIFSEFKPIQDACQSNTPIKMTKQHKAINLAMSLILGGKWS